VGLAAHQLVRPAHEDVVDAPVRLAVLERIRVVSRVRVTRARLVGVQPSVGEVEAATVEHVLALQVADLVRLRVGVEIAHQHGRQKICFDRREHEDALGQVDRLLYPHDAVMKLPVQVGDEHRLAPPRRFEQRVQQ
jgi:hypothetical protein